MRKFFRSQIPSMFHRRLTLLSAAATLGVLLLLAQLANLTLAQGQDRRARAEAALQEDYLIPTTRGRIVDRHGRVLAEEQPAFAIAVRYEVVAGGWAYRRGLEMARAAERSRWAELSSQQQEALIAEHARPFMVQAESLWEILADLGHVERADIEARRDAIKARVQQMASVVWRRQQASQSQRFAEEVRFGEVAQQRIAEQQAYHEVLTAADPATLLRVQRFIAEAQARQQARDPLTNRRLLNDLEIWLHVEPQRGSERAYPFETLTVELDRSRLPPPLRRDTPLSITLEGVGTHLVGTLRGVWQEDVARLPFGSVGPDGQPRRGPDGQPLVDLRGYLPGDQTGAWGVERSAELLLRGVRGKLVERLDTHEERIDPPQPGQDVTLTIDIQLQARVQAILDARDPDDPNDPGLGLMRVQAYHPKHPDSPLGHLEPQRGEPLTGAAVVLDVASGEVLAAASAPALSLRQLREDPRGAYDPIFAPFVNRVVSRPLQPGSTIKPLVLAAAYSEQRLTADELIRCNGHFYDSPTAFRCWIYKGFGGHTHGELAAPEALARSCNIFFFTLGNRLGLPRITAWYKDFGLGQPTRCGLEEEFAGTLPDLAGGGRSLHASDAVNMGIGQGPILWTPLQAAHAYATIARGGRVVPPRFVRDSHPQPAQSDLRLDPRGVELVLAGMNDGVNANWGTGHHLNLGGGVRPRIFDDFPGVRLYGKSGTADPGAPLRIDSDGDGRITAADQAVRAGDHAWFATLVQKPGSLRPDYVIVVVVEYGGSGGTVAGPIVNQLLHALRAEGYL